MYATLGKLYFIDLVYEISENTLEYDSSIPCDSRLNFTFDNCLYDKMYEGTYDFFKVAINNHLKKFLDV